MAETLPSCATSKYSILRLDSDSWDHITQFLGEGDLQRLLIVGSTPLRSRLTVAARHVRLVWFGPHYVDFTDVLHHVTLFRNVTSLSFRTKHKSILHWKPINWSLLPRQLIHLELRFLGSINEFLANSELKTLLPVLKTLAVHDFLPKLLSRTPSATTINLNGLPESLQVLRLIAPERTFKLNPAHIQTLPPYLETLDLRFYPIFEPTFLVAPRLQHLPKTLQTLIIPGTYLSKWLISVSDLPATLTSLHLFDEMIAHVTDLEQVMISRSGTLVNLEGITTHLPRLHTLIAKELVLTALEAATLIPASITHLNLKVDKDSPLSDLLDIPKHVFRALASYSCTGGQLDHLVLADLSTPSDRKLTHLVTRNSSVTPPSSVKTLDAFEIYPSMLPNSITELEVERAFLPQSADIMRSYIFPATLRRLICPFDRTLPHEIVLALPDSLETFAAKLSEKTLGSLFQLMSTTSRLPNLTKLRNFQKCTLGSLLNLPSQLLKLIITDVEPDDTESINASALKALSSSHLTTFDILFKEGRSMPGDIINVLRHLPNSLTKLSVAADCQLNQRWPVSWPPRLRSLVWYGGEKSNRRSAIQSSEFKLPSLLEQLWIYGDDELPLSCFPPHLSQYETGDEPDKGPNRWEQYVNSIPRPPSRGLLTPGGL